MNQRMSGVTHSAHASAGPALPADLDEAAHRCLVAGFEGTTTVPDTLKRLIDRGLGGVILFTRNVRDAEQVRGLTDTLRTIRPDVLVAIDNEGGGIGHLVSAGAPDVPGSWALGVVDDPRLTARCADALAGHLASLGITASYAPVADVQHHPANPIVLVDKAILPYYMYHSMLVYFANGGGPCYIVSTGNFQTNTSASSTSGP